MVTGLKVDLNTKLKMTYTAKCERVAHLDIEMQAKLRRIFNNHIYPIIRCEFGWLYESVNAWLDEQDVTLFHILVIPCIFGILYSLELFLGGKCCNDQSTFAISSRACMTSFLLFASWNHSSIQR